jgi:predicted  nucleic acid-binding Zn-ribbon protein
MGYVDHYLPTLESGGVSYTLGESHQNWEKYKGSIAWADSITELSNFDPGRIIGKSGSTIYTNFRPLSMSNSYKYNYGTMDIYSGGSTYYCRGVRQFFECPMAPLYVENISVPAISYGSQMLQGDAQLTLTLYSASGGALGEALYTLTCTAADIVNKGTQSVGGNTLKTGTLVFKPEEGEEIYLTDEFAVVIEGFQDSGVDVGLAAALIDPCDQETLCQGANMLLQDEWHNDIDATLTFNTRVPCISIRGMYDGMKMVSSGDNLSLTAPEDGGTCKTADGKHTTVSLKTAIAWKATSAHPNYEIEGLPEWLTVKVDESKRYFISGNNYGHGLVTLTFTAEALPEGETLRSAELFIKGRGVQTDEPIVITQERLDKSAEETMLSDLQAQMSDLEANVSNLEAQQETLTGLYEENKNKANSLLSQTTTLREETRNNASLTDEDKEQLDEEIGELENRLNELLEENERLNNALGGIAEAIRNIKGDAETLKGTFAALESELESANNVATLGVVSGKLSAALESLSGAATSLTDNQTEYDNNQSALEAINGELGEKEGELGELKERISALELGIQLLQNRQSSTVEVYTVDGRLLRRGVTSLTDLPAGLYLINKKIVVVK